VLGTSHQFICAGRSAQDPYNKAAADSLKWLVALLMSSELRCTDACPRHYLLRAGVP
jgi:hypothetical protein